MLRVARHSGARTLVGENVPNLLTIRQGKDFRMLTLEEAVAIALTQIE